MQDEVRHGEEVLINPCFGGSGKASWRRQHLSRVQEDKQSILSTGRGGKFCTKKAAAKKLAAKKTSVASTSTAAENTNKEASVNGINFTVKPVSGTIYS